MVGEEIRKLSHFFGQKLSLLQFCSILHRRTDVMSETHKEKHTETKINSPFTVEGKQLVYSCGSRALHTAGVAHAAIAWVQTSPGSHAVTVGVRSGQV